MNFKRSSRAWSFNDVIYQLHQAYRCQIANLHPKSIIRELLHPFGSNNQSLVEETSNEVNSQNTEPTERREALWSLIIYNIKCNKGFYVITDCLYAHDEYYGAGAEVGLKNRAHCTGVQLEKVETVVLPLPFLQHHLQLALGVRWQETKVNTRQHTLRKEETACKTTSHTGEALDHVQTTERNHFIHFNETTAELVMQKSWSWFNTIGQSKTCRHTFLVITLQREWGMSKAYISIIKTKNKSHFWFEPGKLALLFSNLVIQKPSMFILPCPCSCCKKSW